MIPISRGLKHHLIGLLCIGLCLQFIGVGTALAEEGDDPSFISTGVGYYDIFGDDEAGEFRVEYRNNYRFLLFKPFVGVALTTEQAVFAYAGVLTDFYFGRRIVVTPSVAPGYYHNGNGKDLGHEFEIKSGLEFSYRLDDRSRISLHFYHLSNAGLEDTRPGVEVLGTSYSIPLN